MKEKEKHETNLVRRNWSQHRRVRNHYFGSRWVRRATANNPAKLRGETNASRSNKVSAHSRWHVLGEEGSVTAEFAIVLPGVMLVLFVSLSVLTLQTSRIALVQLAAEGSRAIARGEGEQLVDKLVAESGLGSNLSFNSSFKDLSVCVEVVQRQEFRALGAIFPIELKEHQCSRKGGL